MGLTPEEAAAFGSALDMPEPENLSPVPTKTPENDPELPVPDPMERAPVGWKDAVCAECGHNWGKRPAGHSVSHSLCPKADPAAAVPAPEKPKRGRPPKAKALETAQNNPVLQALANAPIDDESAPALPTPPGVRAIIGAQFKPAAPAESYVHKVVIECDPAFLEILRALLK